MASFPVLQTGAVAQYPSFRSVRAAARILRFVDGSEQRFKQFGAPVRSWVIRLDRVSEEELAVIEAFFVSQQGSFGSFAFTDPWDGTEYPDCSFGADELDFRLVDESGGATSLTINNNQVD